MWIMPQYNFIFWFWNSRQYFTSTNVIYMEYMLLCYVKSLITANRRAVSADNVCTLCITFLFCRTMFPLGGRHLPPEEVEQHEDHQMRCLQFMWNSADYKCYANHNQSAVIMEAWTSWQHFRFAVVPKCDSNHLWHLTQCMNSVIIVQCSAATKTFISDLFCN